MKPIKITIVLTAALLFIFTSCKKKDAPKVTPILTPVAIDTVSVFTGTTWILYRYGSGNNYNDMIDSGDTTTNTSLDNSMFESNGFYFDTSVVGHYSNSGYWYFTGTSKSVFEFAKDTIHTPSEIDVCSIYSITDSTLIIIDSSVGPPYLWKFFRKG